MSFADSKAENNRSGFPCSFQVVRIKRPKENDFIMSTSII